MTTIANQEAPPHDDTRWGQFASRLIGVLVRPAQFFKGFAADDELPGTVDILFPHATLLIGVTALAQGSSMLFRGASALAAFGVLISTLVASFALVLGLALVILLVGRAQEGTTTFRRALVLSAYGLSPLFVVGIVALLPIPGVAAIAQLLAMPLAFAAIGAGLIPCARIPEARGMRALALVVGALLIGWTVLAGLPIVAFEF